jgi:hypothetical protein
LNFVKFADKGRKKNEKKLRYSLPRAPIEARTLDLVGVKAMPYHVSFGSI